jgi:hypothetical protein
VAVEVTNESRFTSRSVAELEDLLLATMSCNGYTQRSTLETKCASTKCRWERQCKRDDRNGERERKGVHLLLSLEFDWLPRGGTSVTSYAVE